jgi:hypothetical protein
MLYTSEARKAQYLSYRECGISAPEAAKRTGLAASTARDVWRKAGELEVLYSANNLPPPSIEQLVAVKPKTGRPKVLTNADCAVIFAACTANKKARRRQ